MPRIRSFIILYISLLLPWQGLRLVLERSKSLELFGRRMVVFLVEVASLYEAFGESLYRACQCIKPGSTFSEAPLGDTTQRLFDSVHSFSAQFQGLAGTYRIRLATPLKRFLTSSGDKINNSYQRYKEARLVSCLARQKAVAARIKYASAVRDTETAFQDWMEPSRPFLRCRWKWA